ncbi:hypothetical protein AB4Y40_34040 [Paraburkholderia sp. EG287B]|uniref:hypothetical protein n=1 Tax=Paraburkholderia sp. EG287B TaxID=3237010 RepID=UPI0034D22ED5
MMIKVAHQFVASPLAAPTGCNPECGDDQHKRASNQTGQKWVHVKILPLAQSASYSVIRTFNKYSRSPSNRNLEKEVHQLLAQNAALEIRLRMHILALSEIVQIVTNRTNRSASAKTFRRSAEAIFASSKGSDSSEAYWSAAQSELDTLTSEFDQLNCTKALDEGEHLSSKQGTHSIDEESRGILLCTTMAAVKCLFAQHPDPEELNDFWSAHIAALETVVRHAPNLSASSIKWAKSLLNEHAVIEKPTLLH